MSHLSTTIRVEASPEAVFDLIAERVAEAEASEPGAGVRHAADGPQPAAGIGAE